MFKMVEEIETKETETEEAVDEEAEAVAMEAE